MTRDDLHSVFNEPHLRGEPPKADPSEHAADRTLRDSPSAAPADSVFDEPDIHGRPADLVDHDWSCAHCGYNRRGLMTDQRCPECGHFEPYRPAPLGADGYGSWLSQRIAATPHWRGALTAALLAIAGGPFALLAVMVSDQPIGALGLAAAVLVAPVLEETLKIALLLMVIETRPYLLTHALQLRLAGLGAALCFALVENVYYLYVLIPNPSLGLSLWRWTVCVALHAGCSLIAAGGAYQTWQRCINERRPPNLLWAMPALTAAMLIHAVYNLAVTLFEPLLV